MSPHPTLIIQGGLQRQQSVFLFISRTPMSLIDKLFAITVAIVAAIFGGLLLLNRDSAVRIGGHIERFVADVLQLTLYCLIFIIIFSAVAGLVFLWAFISKRRLENMRQRDGSYPLQRIKINGGWIYVDPNKIIAPAIAVGGRGAVELFTADAELHLRHAIERAKVSQMQALVPGDAAIESRYGSMYRPGAVFNNATGRYLANAYERVQRQLPQPPAAPEPMPEAPAMQRIRLSDAMNRCIQTQLIAGQADDGALAIFNPLSSIHGGIIGATGTGKTTSVGYSLVAQALRTGYHVVIIDPKGGVDWSPWSQHVEWHESTPDVFPLQVEALWAEHERRMRLVREANVRTIDDIGGVPHVIVVIEEYGDLISQLRRGDRRTADATDNLLDRLMRLSRASGIHLLMIDQYPEEWSQQVIGNTKWLATFRLGPNQGAKVRQYNADRLPDYGRFIVREREYNAWFAAPYLEKILSFVPASTLRVIDGEFTVQPDGGVATSGEQSMNGAMNGAMNAPSTLEGWYEWTLANYLPHHPELLQVDANGRGIGVRALAEAMAAHGRGDVSQYEAMKGVASEVAKRLRMNFRAS
jgi:hypothetical protein